jgi:hypothetical protein
MDLIIDPVEKLLGVADGQKKNDLGSPESVVAQTVQKGAKKDPNICHVTVSVHGRLALRLSESFLTSPSPLST